MEKSAHYFIVGLFVSVAIFALVGFTIWLAGDHDNKNLKFYTVQFSDSISGLESGSSIGYRGVKVGKVMDIRLVPTDTTLVEADIGVDKTTPVGAKTKVGLQTQGITGLVRLELSTENGDTEPPPVLAGHKYPVLKGTGSQLIKALADLPEITAKTKDLITKIDGVFDPVTIVALRQTALNAESLSPDLNGLLTPPNVAAASILLTNLSNSSAQLPDTVDHFKRAADQLHTAASGFSNVITRNKPSIDRFAAEGLPQITSLSKEAQGTAASLKGLADKLKDDPSQVLYQPQARGVEIPK